MPFKCNGGQEIIVDDGKRDTLYFPFQKYKFLLVSQPGDSMHSELQLSLAVAILGARDKKYLKKKSYTSRARSLWLYYFAKLAELDGIRANTTYTSM